METTKTETKWRGLYDRILEFKGEAEDAAKFILQSVVNRFLCRQNPVLGFNKTTPFRRWVYDILSQAEEANTYLAIGGWVLYETFSRKSKFNKPPLPDPENGWKVIDIIKKYDLRSFLLENSRDSIREPAGWLDRFALAYLEDLSIFSYKLRNKNYELIVSTGVELASKPGIAKNIYNTYLDIDEAEKAKYETIFLLTQAEDFLYIVYELLGSQNE